MSGFDEIQWSGELSPRAYDPPTSKTRWGFKSKNQLALFMVWREWWHDGEVIYAEVLFTSRDWIWL